MLLIRVALRLHDFQRDRRAVTAIEYALIAGAIFVVIVVGVTHVGDSVLSIFTKVGSEI